LPTVKVEQDENPYFRMRPQLSEITHQFLQQYWPLRFDSAAVLAGIREKLASHEVRAVLCCAVLCCAVLCCAVLELSLV
jgi:hypothetical protein